MTSMFDLYEFWEESYTKHVIDPFQYFLSHENLLSEEDKEMARSSSGQESGL